MRLLQRSGAGDVILTKDITDGRIPQYAILSHTWGDDEVTYKSILDSTGKWKAAFAKIKFCGTRAERDGLKYFWVDSCCIDKSNSSELQESINSMFRWYRDAAKCYVYLTDVSSPAEGLNGRDIWEPAFRKSRWFTRGWTLQELIAPHVVEFYSKEGVLLGDKVSLEQQIHEITGLPLEVLRGTSLEDFSVTERMTWAAKRVTTREEDKAYSLLGIFNTYMPLIYGEGEKNALRRLEAEIEAATRVPFPRMQVATNAGFDSRAEEHNPRCHPDTRTSLLSQIQDWTENPESHCIFWLNGIAGTGKSTISRTVATRLKQRGILGASFFFKRGERDRGNANLFIPTIASQLSLNNMQVKRYVAEALDHDSSISSKGLKEQFDKLISTPLDFSYRNLLSKPTIAIIVDALDECHGDDDIRLIIHLFSQSDALKSVRFRIFITSRPELPVRLGFKNVSGRYECVLLHEIPNQVIGRDIYVYLEHELARIRDKYNSDAFEDDQLPRNWPGEQEVRNLTTMAAPLFIVASTMCRFVADDTYNDPLGQLKKIKRNEIATHNELDGLHFSYLPVLDQFTAGASGTACRSLMEDFRVIVGSIVVIAEPLSAKHLSRLLNVSIPRISRVLRRLHSVLDVPSRTDLPVRAFHQSFRDFLLDRKKIRDFDRVPFWIKEEKMHRSIADRCLRLLIGNGALRKNVCDVLHPGITRSSIDQQTIDGALSLDVQYACRYWVYHWVKSSRSVQTGGIIDLFFRKHLLHWLETLGLLGRMAESISMINQLLDLCDPREPIGKFIADTRRIIFANTPVIDHAPLQVYYSALVFAPERSLVRAAYSSEIPSWLSLLPPVSLGWDACLQTLDGHSDTITAISLSKDSKLLASASKDHTIKLWKLPAGTHMATLKGHAEPIRSVTFADDSKTIVAASYKGIVKYWNLQGVCIRTTIARGLGVRTAAAFDDSQLIVPVSFDGTWQLWNGGTDKHQATLEIATRTFLLFQISNDSKMIATMTKDGVYVWETATGHCVGKTRIEAGTDDIAESGCIAFSPNSESLAIGLSNGSIEVWSSSKRECAAVLSDLGAAVEAICFSPDFHRLAIGLKNISIEIRDSQSYYLINSIPVNTHGVTSLAFTQGSRLLISAGTDANLKVWDHSMAGVSTSAESSSSRVNEIQFSPDARTAMFLSDTTTLWDVNGGKCLQTFARGHSLHRPCAISPNLALLAESSPTHVSIWDIRKKSQVAELDSGLAQYIGFAPNSSLLVSTSHHEKTLKIWRLVNEDGLKSFSTAELWCSNYDLPLTSDPAFSPSSKLLAYWTWGIRVCEAATGTEISSFSPSMDGQKHRNKGCIGFSLDEELLATAKPYHPVWLWHITSITCVAAIDVALPFNSLTLDTPASFMYTDMGSFSFENLPTGFQFDGPLDPSGAITSVKKLAVTRRGIGLSQDCKWVTWGSHQVLWLPPAYRPSRHQISGPNLAIGSVSGLSFILRLSLPDNTSEMSNYP
ncbi:unnamed protein product [Clonostachys rosea]|uniref:NACHT domain-containing protein n=1 Tax=Bionectria ochroleuca TaxID=29856 RepID=A0ABY6V1E0_BIOOC|nr:unnamed protein product [Clonostachys rosea]